MSIPLRYRYGWTKSSRDWKYRTKWGPATERKVLDQDRRDYANANATFRSQQQKANLRASREMQIALSNTSREASNKIANIQAQTKVGLAKSREATTRSGLLAQADASNAAASLSAAEGATQSSRLLTEFETGLQIDRSRRRRALQRDQGTVNAGFAASGIESSAASQDIAAESRLSRASAEPTANQRRQQILNQGRNAITGAISSSVRAGGSLAAGLLGSYGREMSEVASASSDLAQAQVREVAQYKTAKIRDAKTASDILRTSAGPRYGLSPIQENLYSYRGN